MMNALKPVDNTRLNELIAKRHTDGEPSHEFWFVGPEGEPFWSQGPLPVSLMTNLILQPHPDYPEYRILDFESSADHEDITIVRVEEATDARVSFDDLPNMSSNPNYTPPMMSSGSTQALPQNSTFTEPEGPKEFDFSVVFQKDTESDTKQNGSKLSRLQKLSRILRGIFNFRGIL